MIRSIQSYFLFLGALGCVGLVGCGSSGGGVPVKGTLTIAGQPANNVILTLHPEDSTKTPVSGAVTNGSFSLVDEHGNGASPGKYKPVLAMRGGSKEQVEAAMKKGKGPPKPPVPAFPDIYLKAATSDKTVNVTGQSLSIDIPGRHQ